MIDKLPPQEPIPDNEQYLKIANLLLEQLTNKQFSSENTKERNEE